MKLGLSIGYSKAQMDLPVALVQRAEEVGYDSVWSAEAYGSDAVTPLAFLAALTKKIRLGTGIMQLAARTPANAAMRQRRTNTPQCGWPPVMSRRPGLAGHRRSPLGGHLCRNGWKAEPPGKQRAPRCRHFFRKQSEI